MLLGVLDFTVVPLEGQPFSLLEEVRSLRVGVAIYFWCIPYTKC